MSLLNNLIAGISLGSVYAIIALGYSMVYGIARMLNFAPVSYTHLDVYKRQVNASWPGVSRKVTGWSLTVTW